MAPHLTAACRLCVVFLLLSTATLSSASSSSDAAICTIPSHPPKFLASNKHNNTIALLQLFRLNAGYFFGGVDIHFAKDDTNASFVTRSFSFFPHRVDSTTDNSLVHVAATLSLSGGRAPRNLTSQRRRRWYLGDHSVNFYLDGYHSSTSDELCMTGSGTYSSDDGSIERLEGVVLKLRMPSRPSLSDPFVTGLLQGASFKTISLVAYAQGGYHYKDSESVSCPTSSQPPSTARGAFQALGSSFSCAHLKEHIATAYKLGYGGGGAHPMGIQARRCMHVGQVQCGNHGEVRAYAAFSNDTNMWGLQPHPPFMLGEEVVVAEGRWDSHRGMLCLMACRVEHSESETTTSVAVTKECDIGMTFWCWE